MTYPLIEKQNNSLILNITEFKGPILLRNYTFNEVMMSSFFAFSLQSKFGKQNVITRIVLCSTM